MEQVVVELKRYRDVLVELPEFFVLGTKPFIPPSELTIQSGSIAVDATTKRFTYALPRVSIASADTSSKGALSLTKSTSFIFHVPNGENILQFVANLPMILPQLYKSIEIIGQVVDTSRMSAPVAGVRAYFFTLYKKPEDEKMFSSGYTSFHSVRLICQQICKYAANGSGSNSEFGSNAPILDAVTLRKLVEFVLPADKKTSMLNYYQAEIISTTNPFETIGKLADTPILIEKLNQFILSQGTDLQELFFRNPHYKMWFYTKEWNTLIRYYHSEILGFGISLKDFLELYRILTTDPIVLCFEERIPVFYAVEMKTGEDKFETILRKVPELTLKHLLQILKNYTNKTIASRSQSQEICDIASLCLYQALCNIEEKEKHVYVHLARAQQETIRVAKDAKVHTDVIDALSNFCTGQWWTEFLEKLEKQKIIVFDKLRKNVYKHINWVREDIIALSLKRLYLFSLEKNKTSVINPEFMDPDPESSNRIRQLKTERGHELCDEQLAALRSFIHNPVTIINGPAGSGKTDFLQSLHPVSNKMISSDKLLEASIDALCHQQQHSHQNAKNINQHQNAHPSHTIVIDNKQNIPLKKTTTTTNNDRQTTTTTLKDDVLEALKKQNTAILATSTQGNHASVLNRLFEDTGSTTHKLLLRHFLSCDQFGIHSRVSQENHNTSTTSSNLTSLNSTKRPVEKEKTHKCPFADIRILIIEEASLYTPELAALVLGLLSICAPYFEKLIIVGDENQLPSINGGNFLRDITRAFAFSPLKNSIKFTHNHRVDKQSEILKFNALAILNKQPQKFVFDEDVCVHFPLTIQQQHQHYQSSTSSYQQYAENKKHALEKTLIQIIERFKLDPFQSHVITRINKDRELIDELLRMFFFQKFLKHGSIYNNFTTTTTTNSQDQTFVKHAFYPGFKVIFQNEPSIVSNSIYVILSIFDLHQYRAYNTNTLDSTFVKTTKTITSFFNNKNKKEVDGDDEEEDENQKEEDDYDQTSNSVTKRNNNAKMSSPFGYIHYKMSTEDKNDSRTKTPKRYIVVFELSNHHPLIERHTHLRERSAKVFHEFSNFRKTLTEQLSVSKSDMFSGDPWYPNIKDHTGVFKILKWTRELRDNITSAFVTTINKFQGLQTENLLYCLLTNSEYDTMEAEYTATTRARSRFVLLGDRNSFEKAINNPEPTRLTTLCEQIRIRIEEASKYKQQQISNNSNDDKNNSNNDQQKQQIVKIDVKGSNLKRKRAEDKEQK